MATDPEEMLQRLDELGEDIDEVREKAHHRAMSFGERAGLHR
jgi:hypothetical protein